MDEVVVDAVSSWVRIGLTAGVMIGLLVLAKRFKSAISGQALNGLALELFSLLAGKEAVENGVLGDGSRNPPHLLFGPSPFETGKNIEFNYLDDYPAFCVRVGNNNVTPLFSRRARKVLHKKAVEVVRQIQHERALKILSERGQKNV